MTLREYVPLVVTVLLLAAIMVGGLILTINRPPPDKRAFRSDWSCHFIGDAEICERRKQGPQAEAPG